MSTESASAFAFKLDTIKENFKLVPEITYIGEHRQTIGRSVRREPPVCHPKYPF